MIRTNLLLLMVAAATFQNPNAHAQSPVAPETKTVQIKVAFGDLNLDKPEDARVLVSRVEEAARRACGPKVESPSRYDLTPVAIEHDYKACIANAIGDTVARLNVPLVSRAYAESRAKKPNDVAKR